MTTVKVQYAKTHLSALLHEVEEGAEIVIARGDRAIARLVPVTDPDRERELGFVPYVVPDSFFDDLPDTELAAWQGRG